MNGVPESDVTVGELIADAAEWRLIELLFRRPSDRWKHELRKLSAAVGDPALRAASTAAAQEAEEKVFDSIFGPGGPAPARETSYVVTNQPGKLLSELNAVYEAFAYSPAGPGGEPPDHVAVEAAFIGLLRLKQAYALSRESTSEAASTREAADQFLREHLCNIAEPLSRALDNSGVRYLALAGRALLRRTGPAHKQIADTPQQQPPAQNGDPDGGE